MSDLNPETPCPERPKTNIVKCEACRCEYWDYYNICSATIVTVDDHGICMGYQDKHRSEGS